MLSCGRKPALKLSEGSNQITPVSYRGPVFSRDTLPSAVLTRPVELRYGLMAELWLEVVMCYAEKS